MKMSLKGPNLKFLNWISDDLDRHFLLLVWILSIG